MRDRWPRAGRGMRQRRGNVSLDSGERLPRACSHALFAAEDRSAKRQTVVLSRGLRQSGWIEEVAV